MQLEANEPHRPHRVVATVNRRQPVRHEIHRNEAASAERQVIGYRKVTHRAQRCLPDPEGWAVQDALELSRLVNEDLATVR